MKENAFDKSRRYLIEGRVVLTQVTPQRVDAFVRGAAECCHLRAVRLVTAPDLPPHLIHLRERKTEMTEQEGRHG